MVSIPPGRLLPLYSCKCCMSLMVEYKYFKNMISILYGNVQEHFNQGVGSFVDGRRARQKRPRIKVIMSD
jgi:hypothetical protein